MAAPRTLLNTLGLMAAAVVAAPSLLWPFGRDQAQFAYVGAAWLDGLVPYLDTFDHKPPAIYALYALADAVGPVVPAVRVMEMAAILTLGALVPRALRLAPRPGEVGASALLLAALYYTLFDFWNTAQVELWMGLALVAALVAARRARPAAAGALVAAAMLFKPTALLPGALIAALALARSASSAGRWARPALAFMASGTAIGALALMPFALGGGLTALWDVLVDFNRIYAQAWPGAEAPPSVVWPQFIGPAVVALTLLLLGVAAALRRHDHASLREGAYLAALLLSAYASVALQQKFFYYHWLALLPFMALIMLWAWRAIARSGPEAPAAPLPRLRGRVGLSFRQPGVGATPPEQEPTQSSEPGVGATPPEQEPTQSSEPGVGATPPEQERTQSAEPGAPPPRSVAPDLPLRGGGVGWRGQPVAESTPSVAEGDLPPAPLEGEGGCDAAGRGVVPDARPPLPGMAVCVLGLVAAVGLCPPWWSNPEMSYARFIAERVSGGRAEVSDDARLAPFTRPGFSAADVQALGEGIAAVASPGDTLCVAAFEPGIYLRAGLRCPSPFFSDHPLRNPAAKAVTGPWAVVHEAALLAHPPTFVIAQLGDGITLEGLWADGYAPLLRRGGYVVMAAEGRGRP